MNRQIGLGVQDRHHELGDRRAAGGDPEVDMGQGGVGQGRSQLESGAP